MITNVAIKGATVNIQVWIYILRSASKVSTSLENLLIIRPRGVVSKKDIGFFRMLSNRSECRLREAKIHPMAIDAARQNEPKARTEIMFI